MPDVTCPYCGETVEVELSPEEEEADVVQDCTVCCRPIRIRRSRRDLRAETDDD